MLGILLLYFIAKPFYQLAEQHDKNKWVFAILGVVAYYSGAFVMGIILGIVSPGTVETMNNLLLGLMAIPLGLLFAWLLYRMLENNWSKSARGDVKDSDSDILDQNLN